MRITKKKYLFSLTCDLGLVTSNKLSWNARVDKISSKPNKILALIKSTCRCLNDVATVRTRALVRSQLEYCTIIWSPHTAIRNLNKLERIQWRATKYILKTDDDYGTRIEKLNLFSLQDRRFF